MHVLLRLYFFSVAHIAHVARSNRIALAGQLRQSGQQQSIISKASLSFWYELFVYPID